MIDGVSSIGNVTAFDVPPHGLTTVIEAVPGLAMRVADTVAVSCVEETNVVVSAAPFQFTVEVETKFVPLTVNVNCESPAEAQVGLSELMVGTALIVNVAAPDFARAPSHGDRGRARSRNERSWHRGRKPCRRDKRRGERASVPIHRSTLRRNCCRSPSA